EGPLLERRKSKVMTGEWSHYGMALSVDKEWGVEIVHHGGDIVGFHSDMFWIPEADVGGVILTNGNGYLIRRAFIRKTLEALYDGKPEAEEDAAGAIATHKAAVVAERPRLTVPPDAAVISKLAKKYTSSALGDIIVSGTTFDFGGWKSPV